MTEEDTTAENKSFVICQNAYWWVMKFQDYGGMSQKCCPASESLWILWQDNEPKHSAEKTQCPEVTQNLLNICLRCNAMQSDAIFVSL